MNDVLVADSIGKSFGSRRVLTAASINVRAGRITTLLGRNGCGKTTLIRIVAGFTRADHGIIWFRGKPCARPRLAQLAREGLFLLPDRDLLCRGRDVRDHFRPLHERWPLARDSTADAIERLGIRPLLGRPPERLSGGEKRRAELALALARQPACLVADEPFHGVAPRDAESIAAAFRALAVAGTAVLVTGHEVDTLLDLADDVIWLTAGTTHALGSPADASRHDQFRREYLGPGRLFKPA